MRDATACVECLPRLGPSSEIARRGSNMAEDPTGLSQCAMIPRGAGPACHLSRGRLPARHGSYQALLGGGGGGTVQHGWMGACVSTFVIRAVCVGRLGSPACHRAHHISRLQASIIHAAAGVTLRSYLI